MKSINDYIQEALISKGNRDWVDVSDGRVRVNNMPSKVTFQWPTKDDCSEWKTIEMKKPGKFVVYYDKYHKRKHIASFGGALELYIFSGTYEDMTPDIIIKGFKTLKEAVKYALDDDNADGYYDSEEFLDAVMSGRIKESDYGDTTEFKMFETPTKKIIKASMSYLY